MIYKFFCFFILFLTLAFRSLGETTDLKWTNPLDYSAIQGRVTEYKESDYGRLPKSLESDVRSPVWNLSKHSAGLYIDFETDADDILVRYQVSGGISMPHMPSTGVSGVDLYAWKENSQEWSWSPGHYSFDDTISYKFSQLESESSKTYRLYLPLYNQVQWLEIGVPSTSHIHYKFVLQSKPIIIYGTSIAQGACATRPGTAWSNILNRKINQPIVNLGFSGNGRLEQPILDLIGRNEVSIIVLDCLPNLGVTDERSESDLEALIENAIYSLRATHSDVPIILTEHSNGFNPNFLNRAINSRSEQTTMIARKVFSKLQNQGMSNLHLLANIEFNMDIDSTVDYVHPNDIGMLKIANAYYKLIDEILNNN